MKVPKIVISGDSVSLQDFDEVGEGQDVTIEKDGKIITRKIKKTELFEAKEVIRVFNHKPNSYEFGKAGNRHKIHYYSLEDGKKKLNNARDLEKLAIGDTGTQTGTESTEDVDLDFSELNKR